MKARDDCIIKTIIAYIDDGKDVAIDNIILLSVDLDKNDMDKAAVFETLNSVEKVILQERM